MAKNRVYPQGNRTMPNLSVATSVAVAGDPTVVGQLPGVLITNVDAVNQAIIQTDGIFTLSVQGIALSTTSAHGTSVRPGDILYYDSNASCHLNKKSTGVRFGYALGTIAAATSVISAIPVQVGY